MKIGTISSTFLIACLVFAASLSACNKATSNTSNEAKGSCQRPGFGSCRDIVPSSGSSSEVKAYCEKINEDFLEKCPEKSLAGSCKIKIEIGTSIIRVYHDSPFPVSVFKEQCIRGNGEWINP